ncbi:hypothetical protein GCM10010277_37590 [Streptomyces longisporoflavus]|uniref:hypothetical protein n=1 Tax=Streptomyces longisporoflavus TaxID=28044 RepID=UPI0019AF41E0|nr:hypothetical protein [Streptomyces longisporoflavus]GGV46138.1 hypothetical protein GCM10010277_37590 [Streptomyces longisporoflavus]
MQHEGDTFGGPQCVENHKQRAAHGVGEEHFLLRALRAAALAGPDETPGFTAFARYRERFGGPLIANNGFDGDSANALVEAGLADAVSFATHFVANPDLVSRFALGRELADGDPATYYRGGAEGYVDYPAAG